MFRGKLARVRRGLLFTLKSVEPDKMIASSYVSYAKIPIRGLKTSNSQVLSEKAVVLERSNYAVSKISVRAFSKSANTDLPPHEIVLMPALSPTMTAGNIGPWHKKVGDAFEPGDVLCEIETDKAQMDFEVQEEGYLAKILMPEGTKEAQVGKPLAIFVSKKEDVGKFENFVPQDSNDTPSNEQQSTHNAPTATASTTSTNTSTTTDASTTTNTSSTAAAASNSTPSRLKASPLAKKLSSEMGVDLNSIRAGSGPNGRIIKSDVIAASTSSAAASKTQIGPVTPSSTGRYVDIPNSRMRRIIASRLTESKQSIPHYYLRVDVEMDRIMELRGKVNSTPALQESFGSFKLSMNDFIVKAAALSLKQVPAVNSAWYDDFIRQWENVDVCVAVATPAGLMTPIVPDADQRGLVAISNQIKELAARAKANKLKPEEFQGGTFTISNLGMYGVDSFTAIINPPQSCILAVGATVPKLVAHRDDGNSLTKIAHVMSATLSCDHRVVDGATGAQWLAYFKRFLEDPEQMIL